MNLKNWLRSYLGISPLGSEYLRYINTGDSWEIGRIVNGAFVIRAKKDIIIGPEMFYYEESGILLGGEGILVLLCSNDKKSTLEFLRRAHLPSSKGPCEIIISVYNESDTSWAITKGDEPFFGVILLPSNIELKQGGIK